MCKFNIGIVIVFNDMLLVYQFYECYFDLICSVVYVVGVIVQVVGGVFVMCDGVM